VCMIASTFLVVKLSCKQDVPDKQRCQTELGCVLLQRCVSHWA
jgi:hypothetical protein